MSATRTRPTGGTKPSRRELELADLNAVLAELERLAQQGYTAAGNWNLAQICDHLAYFIEGSLDGFSFRAPWLLRYFIGVPMKRRILQTGKMGRMPTPQKPLPDPNLNEKQSVRRLKLAIERLLHPVSQLHDSPFFGPLTPDEWRRLHTIHAAHHLSFLIPADPNIAEDEAVTAQP